MTDATRADSGVPVPGKAAEEAPQGDTQGKTLSHDEREELETLRHEVTTLRGGEPPGDQPPTKHRRGRWRAPVSAVLIVLGCILAPISVLGVWTANQVSNTDRYVATVSPLIQDPAIQAAATDKITTAIMNEINVPALTSQTVTQLNQRGLPRVATLLQNFSGQIASGIQGFVHSTVARIIASPAINAVWLQANRTAHAALVAALSGNNKGALTTSNGQVVLNLQPFIKVAQQDLVNRGLTFLDKLPTPNATFPLFPSRDLVKAQTAYRLINDLKIILPILCLLLIAAGVYVARSHRRALIGAGLGFAASMFVLAAILLIVRNAYLNAIPNNTLPSDAAAAAFDIMVRFIRIALRALLLVGLVVAAAAFLSGPSAAAVRIRSWFAAGFNWLRHRGENLGVSSGPVGDWTYAHRRGLRIGVVALLCLIFVFLGQPTVGLVITLVVVLLVLLGLIELIGRPPAPSASGAPPPGPPGPPGPPAPRSPEPQAH
jgi:hypothetical protein